MAGRGGFRLQDAGTENSQDSTIAAYRLERGTRVRLLLTMLLACAGAAYELAILLFKNQTPGNMVFGILVLTLLAWVIHFYVRMVTGYTCTTLGLELTTLLGEREMIRWGEMQLFHDKGSRVVLISKDHPMFYFYQFPEKALENLVAALREASKARIFGFGQQI